MNQSAPPRLSHAELLELKRWNTPTIYNGWEQLTRHDAAQDGFNLEEVRDFMPQMGPMVGYAVTVVFEPGNPRHPRENPQAWSDYRAYVGSVPGPKIVVVQDLDKPRVMRRLLGRGQQQHPQGAGLRGDHHRRGDSRRRRNDQRRLQGPGPAAVRGACLQHARALGVRGRGLRPHGPAGPAHPCRQARFSGRSARGRSRGLLEAARFMDANECQTMIAAARGAAGKPIERDPGGLRRRGPAVRRERRGQVRQKGRMVSLPGMSPGSCQWSWRRRSR